MAVNVDILGKGWRFPFAITKRKGGTGTSASLSKSEGIEHVKESSQQSPFPKPRKPRWRLGAEAKRLCRGRRRAAVVPIGPR